MIALDSRRWYELRDAHGSAGHIPGILRRLSAGEDAWMELYDAFALVYRREISEAAFAVIPYIERIAAESASDQLECLVFAGRVAYIGRSNCAWMAPDVLAPCLASFAKLSQVAKRLLPQSTGGVALDLAKAILAFEQCPTIYDAVDELSHSEVHLRCRADVCGIELWLVPHGEGLAAVLPHEVDEEPDPVEHVVAPRAMLTFDRDASWM